MNTNSYRIYRAGSARAAKWKPVEITWPEFLAKLNAPSRTGETVAEYQRMSKAEKAAIKDAAGGFVAGELLNGKRSNRTVRNRTMVTLDADKAYPDQWEDVTLLCDYQMAMYSTHSHTPDAPRLRFILPLSRPVTPDEYGAIARKLATLIGIETMDRTTYEPARLMYWPSCPSDGEYLFRQQEGPVVEADAVLAEYGPDDAWKDTTLWPCSRDEVEVVQRELKELGDPRAKQGLVGAFCRAYDVEKVIEDFLPGVYEPCETHSREPRYTYVGGSTYGGVSVYNDGQLLFSRHDTDPAGGGIHCQNAFDLVRIHKFGHLDKQGASPDPTKRPSYKAMCDWVLSLDEIKMRLAEERMAAVEAAFGDMGEIVAEKTDEAPAEEAEEPPKEWTKQLTYKPKTDELEATAANVLLILRNDPKLTGALAYNEILERPVIVNPLPWHARVVDQRDGDPWIDSDSSNLRVYLEQVWGLKNRADIQDALQVVQEENRFNPLRDYLASLHWDGRERLDTLLVRYLNADDGPYVRAVTRKWFVAAVARVFEPGRKFDNMLVLCGPQGVGKSSLVQIMARGRFSDSITDLKGKSAYEQLQGAWLVEFAELASMKRAEVETVKNFITKPEDTYRPAYGQFLRTYKRQCVFFGTTNDIEFLKDRTGNRRFWPVEVRGPEIIPEGGVLVGLREEVAQLWAEAVARYKEGEALWLNDALLQRAARDEQERFTVQDEFGGQIIEYLDTLLPERWPELSQEERAAFIRGESVLDLGPCNLKRNLVSNVEIRCELCKEDRTKGGGSDLLSRRIANLMNNMPGWKKLPKKRRLGVYGPQWVYQRITAQNEQGPAEPFEMVKDGIVNKI